MAPEDEDASAADTAVENPPRKAARPDADTERTLVEAAAPVAAPPPRADATAGTLAAPGLDSPPATTPSALARASASALPQLIDASLPSLAEAGFAARYETRRLLGAGGMG